MPHVTIPSETLNVLDAYWRAANYLSVGQIYLKDNPLLREPLRTEHIKKRLLGHWGTTPGLNFIWAHLNRLIVERDLNLLYVCGPGHGGPGAVANAYLEGTYSEVYPDISLDAAGIARLFKQFSFPGGIPSHVAPETPGSLHEGGELGYALSHAFGAAFDNPNLVVACIIGDGEAETGPLATSWHSNKFLHPARDGVVLPILHLNGYKIAGPTVLARIPHEELHSLLSGYGYEPFFVEGHDPQAMHQLMASTLDTIFEKLHAIREKALAEAVPTRPKWPMIVLRSPKGWTGPKHADGREIEGTSHSHQVPFSDMDKPEHVALLETWLKSYRPEELFLESGRPKPEILGFAPRGTRRMSANPHTNGGQLLEELTLPDFRNYGVSVSHPGAHDAESTRIQGAFIRDIISANPANFRVFSPDETASNRWNPVFEVTNRVSMAAIQSNDEGLAAVGRVMEMLSEHQCQGWLEGYLLTGRHGFLSCYEAFIHIIDSMFNQHAKWLKVTNHIPWRKPIASLNYLLTSHVWRQDHNGFSHQDPGFLDHVVNKKAEVIRVYLPPDANTLLSVTDHCLRSKQYVNVVVAGKQPAPQWLNIEEATRHAQAGVSIWTWASNDAGGDPDVVIASAGDVPTLEALAATSILRELAPELRIRFVNVIDLMRLQPQEEHPHGLSSAAFDAIFTKDRPIVFAFHGYPTLIHRLSYRRTNHANLHVRGYKEEGTTTTPFDMTVLNDLDRFHLVMDVAKRVSCLGEKRETIIQAMEARLSAHHDYIREHGEDMPEVKDWRWR
ncbi:MAG: phosphoketolase family protein [Polyangiaceae bacterium]|nr:phosphoketolase family protein [Polyangiaceae bacterium]